MADEVVPLRSAQGSFLCTVSYYRMPDGSIRAALEDMPSHVIEGEETITKRFFKAAQWAISGSLDLMQQGLRFDEETRACNADAPPTSGDTTPSQQGDET